MTQDQTPSLRFPEFRGAWAVKPLSGVIKVITPPKKLPTREYDKTGSFPIIDQSKSQISGWTDDKESIIDKGLPLIIFGDHTCVIKIAKNPFAQGADGIKIFGGLSDLTTEYLYQYLQFKPLESKEYKRHFSLLKERKVFYPDKKSGEMQKITECLLSLDEVIVAQGDRLDGLKDYKRGLMQQIFPADGQTTPTLRFPEFQGKAPWQEKFTYEFGTISTGGTPSTSKKDYWGGEFTWVTPTDISEQKDIFTSQRKITELGMDKVGHLPENTVLITCIASIGKNAILRTKGSCNQQINVIIPNKEYNPDFLYYLLELQKNYLSDQAGVSATKILSKSNFQNLSFFVPPLTEQQRIADCLSSLDELITAQEQKIKTLKHHKNGLMQQLFPEL